MEPPRKLLMKPWDYQLKGAAQIHHACEGPLKGLILGDEMGTGKTLQAVLAAYRVRNEPGMSLVVAPVSAIQNWLDTCSLSWKEVSSYVDVEISDTLSLAGNGYRLIRR